MAVLYSALTHDALEGAGLPGVSQVWFPKEGTGRLLQIVAIKQRYFGHPKQAALLCSQVQPAPYLGRMTVVAVPPYLRNDPGLKHKADILFLMTSPPRAPGRVETFQALFVWHHRYRLEPGRVVHYPRPDSRPQDTRQ